MRPRGEERLREPQPDNNGLAEYRRLVELQKQMVELMKQNRQSKAACVALREQIARETAALCRGPRWQRQLKGLRASLFRQLGQTSFLFKRFYRSNGSVSAKPSDI